MIEPEHKMLTQKRETLKAAIESAIQDFEDNNGIYVDSIIYGKNLQVKQFDIKLTLELKGVIR